MKKFSLILLFVFSIHFLGLSQGCLPEGITFTNQIEINNFPENYQYCTEIEGDVEISGFDITNLDSLHVLMAIGGDLVIDDNPFLGSLEGLDNLTSIGGDLQIFLSYNMSNLQGLESLEQIGGMLYVTQNFELTGFEGLENLESVGEGITIFENPLLENISMESLTNVGGSLTLVNNMALHNLDGLESLETIGANLFIEDHDVLSNLDGLSALTTIGGNLHICLNPELTSLSGLDSINPNSIENLNICNNPTLATCHVKSVCDYLGDPNGEIEIHGNATGCDNTDEVLEACFTGLPENLTASENMIVFPNPANEKIQFIVNKKITILKVTFYDLTGIKVLTTTPENNSIITSYLSKGIYFLEIETNNGSIRTKLVVE